jgi:outer membrane biosynthesis protein TonB
VNDSVPPPASGGRRFAVKRAWLAPLAGAAAIVTIWLAVRGMTEPSSSTAAEPAPSNLSTAPTTLVPVKAPEPTASPAPPAADPAPAPVPTTKDESAQPSAKKKKKTAPRKPPRKKRYSPTRI